MIPSVSPVVLAQAEPLPAAVTGVVLSPSHPSEEPAGSGTEGSGRAFRLPRAGLLLSGLFISLLALATIAPGVLTSVDPQAVDARNAFAAPDARHWLGTDENGRDVLARLIFGTGTSLGIGSAAMLVSLGLGVIVGLIGGLGGRIFDSMSMRFADTMAAVPNILFALLIITFWGQSTVNIIIAIGVATMPRYARLVRTHARTIRSASFVEAATTLGLRRSTVVWRHIIPNAIKPALLLSVISIGGKIAAAASLSFLGFGSPPPAPEWGAMLAVGRHYMSIAPWLVLAPALTVTLTVLAISVIGREIIRRSEGRSA